MGIRKYYWKIREYLSDTNKKPISVIPSRSGQLFEVNDLFIGRLVTPVHEIHELDIIKSGFEFKLPRIPGHLLEQIISFFRDFCERYETEVMIQIYYDTISNEYVLECPLQYVSKISVDCTPIPLNPRRYKKIMDVHSHNTMDAYFSATDNADEVNPLLYGVIGKLDTEPTMVFRVGKNGYWIELPVQHIFEEFDRNNHIKYPDKWIDRVVIKGER